MTLAPSREEAVTEPATGFAVEPISFDPPAPSGRPVLRQRWEELAYFHWPYEPAAVQRLLPDGVFVDTFDGAAWVGLIPFEMRRIRIGPTPPIPWLGSFVEVNVRTYVIDRHGRRAVWFFSLDVPRALPVAVARGAFGLPYCWARADHDVDGDVHRYLVERRRPHRARGRADMSFRVGEEIRDPGPLSHFLSARWALLTMRGRTLQYGPVRHERWPLHAVHDVAIDQDLIEAAGLPTPSGPIHAMFSPGVSVDIEWLRAIA